MTGVASLAKAGARSSAAVAVVVRRVETAAAAEVHHEEDKFTTLNFGEYRGSVHILKLSHFPDFSTSDWHIETGGGHKIKIKDYSLILIGR